MECILFIFIFQKPAYFARVSAGGPPALDPLQLSLATPPAELTSMTSELLGQLSLNFDDPLLLRTDSVVAMDTTGVIRSQCVLRCVVL